MVTTTHEKVTIYLGDLWGFDRIEARDVAWQIVPYAQHTQVARVTYVPKGKRKPQTAVVTSSPIVILDGWDHPEPPAKYGVSEQLSENVRVQTTRRLSCDPEWAHEFRAFLTGYLAGSGAMVLMQRNLDMAMPASGLRS